MGLLINYDPVTNIWKINRFGDFIYKLINPSKMFSFQSYLHIFGWILEPQILKISMKNETNEFFESLFVLSAKQHLLDKMSLQTHVPD